MVFDACLADLDARLDDQQELAKRQEWQRFLDDRWEGEYFTPSPRTPAPASVDWPAVHINDAIEDIDLMVLSELAGCSAALADGGRAPLNVRCNYGTAIMPLLFGCELFVMPRETSTLPTAVPFHSDDDVRRLLDAGVPDVRTGLGGRLFDTAERFLAVFEAYPAVGRNVTLYHPDVQGPVDIAEMVWGSEMFYAFIEQPDLVKQFLAMLTDTYTAFMAAWFDLVPPTPEFSPHWGLVHKGPLMLRNDSLMNLSGEMYVEFVRPVDQPLFDSFDGGAVHFCGRGDHYIEAMCQMDGLTAINMSQPELNDMEVIFRNTVDKGIKLVGLGGMDLDNVGRPLRGQVQTG